ncbi:odorant receptor Or1-like [Tenebrio molitor]|uniref:odorant receptor Or1-like n=1 Tax=Tenebrio molitor TaxID=7067 RepID=UPI0036248C89
MKKFDWKLTIRLNIILLKVVGLWPKGDETYKCNLYTAYAIISGTLFTIGHNLLQTINLFFIYNNLEAVTATIFVSLTQLLAILKSYYLVQNMGILKQLMVTLNSEMFQPKNAKQKILIEPNLSFWKTIFRAYWGNACCTLFLWAVFPIIDNTVKEFRLPLLVWYPYNTKISPLYEITYIYQIICCYFICIINISVDTLIAALNMYIGAQCDILCDDLRNIDDYSKNSSVDIVNERWINCIMHHKEILRFSENSHRFFNWIVLIQFFTSAVSIGLTMFQLTVVIPFTSEFYSFFFYLMSVTVEIFMYCWFGNEVEIKSSNIPYATFESNWIDATEETKKNILFFVLRCKKPIKMSALNLFYLSLDTFMKILRTSWSYFAVLHQVNVKDLSK